MYVCVGEGVTEGGGRKKDRGERESESLGVS